jgi:hypothetical protein
LITHACSSSTNGCTWGDTISILEEYWRRDPFEKALCVPSLRTHKDEKSYKQAFKLYNEIPIKSWYYVARIFGSKKMKTNATDYVVYMNKTKELVSHFAYFMNNEWVFDNPSAIKLQAMVLESEPGLSLNFDVRSIKWKTFVMNHAYGIKKYVLKEETYMPSMSLADARTLMYKPFISQYTAPWKNKDMFIKKVKSYNETKKFLFADEWVLREMEILVKEKLKKRSREGAYKLSAA